MSTTPVNATAHPVSSERGKPSFRTTPAITAIRIGPTFTIMAAVPASTRRSASLRATL